MATPVPPGLVLAVYRRGAVTVWRRGQGEGQGDHRLARRVEQLDLATLQVRPLREGVDPSGSCQAVVRKLRI